MGEEDRPVTKVLIVGSGQTPSFKIGISQPFRWLRRKGLCTYDVKSELEVTEEHIAAADLIVFVRTFQFSSYQWLKLAQSLGKRTVYSIDDHFPALSPQSPLGKVFFEDPMYERVYLRFIKRAAQVKVASPFFADYIRRHYRKNDIVCFPGSVNFSLFEGLRKPEPDGKTITIGYEGGDKPTAFIPVIPALKRLLSEYDGKVRLEFYGYAPPELEGREHVHVQTSRMAYKPFLKKLYQSGWDIGIAPLENKLLHNCKTNNKFREYAACRIAGVYSDCPAYSPWIQHKKTGYLVSHTEEGWYKGLKDMIEHPELRESIRRKANQTAKERFSIKACAEQWRKYILDAT